MIPITIVKEMSTDNPDSVRTGHLWFWAVFNLKLDAEWHPVHLKGMSYQYKYDTKRFN
jgi:hypothetical protein